MECGLGNNNVFHLKMTKHCQFLIDLEDRRTAS